MSKARRWLIILLTLVAVVLIGINITNRSSDLALSPANNQPAYQGESVQTLVYTPQGTLSYRLVAQHVKYYADSETSWFSLPVMTIFDTGHQPVWRIQADNARLTSNKTLYLHGHVQVSALAANAQLRNIKTDNAKVDLITQDIVSDDRVSLFGPGLYSTGLKMRGNLRDKTARLIEQVKTSYETQTTPSAP